MSQPQIHFVDLLQTGTALTVQWRAAPGVHARAVDAEMVSKIDKQVAVVAEAERRAGLSRDVVAPASGSPGGSGLEAAHRALGETLYLLLDGEDRALARRLDSARQESAPLHLCIRLRTHDRKGLSRHLALGWPFQLLTPRGEDPLVLAAEPMVTLSVQLGDAELTQPERAPGGRLQVLFMAYSPLDVSPVLDYEGEEERILVELAPHVEKNRLVLRVAEEGSLLELRRRLMERAYDIVHLTGHGVVTKHGAQLVMEDADGRRDDVSAERLLRELRDGLRMPRMLVISSCHSAEHRNDLPSLAAELIEGGVPCVVGWTLPVLDTVATNAAAELYRRLCSGERPAEAVCKARRELHHADRAVSSPSHAWATLQMLTTKAAGFAINPEDKPQPEAAAPGGAYRMLGNRMRVLAEGFVGRRRELQMLGRILRRGRWSLPEGGEHAVAGALVVGMKGQGKSCLVGRAVERHHHDAGELSMVVLHGALDDNVLLEAFRVEALRLGDEAAEKSLDDVTRGALQRIERLLRRHWRERRVVIVLDDFEQNLEILGEGDAQLLPFAAAVLEVLLPICRDEQPKLLITSTARFALPPQLKGSLAEMPLGALEATSVHKLWSRGRNAELGGLAPQAWRDLAERFGRNARLLSWVQQLLVGKTPEAVQRVMSAAREKLPVWKEEAVDEEKQDQLLAAFLRHMGLEEAKRKVGTDAMVFIERARVYAEPVPVEAFAGLIDGLNISIERCVAALSNLGLLELGSENDRVVYRVSPLVKSQFDDPDGERWQAVAAEYWWKASAQPEGRLMAWVLNSWEHALAAGRQDLADRAGSLLDAWTHRRGIYAHGAELAARHLARLPESAAALRWSGAALLGLGKLQQSRAHFERALEIEEKMHGATAHLSIAATLHEIARVMQAQGDLAGARTRLERALELLRSMTGTEEHSMVAASFYELGRVLHAQGQFAIAREKLERALELEEQLYGSQDHLDIAASLHEIALVLHTQGDVAGGRAKMERSLEIQIRLHGTDEHPTVATSLHALAMILHAQGDTAGAQTRLERALEIKEKVYGTQEHPSVAASFQELGRVLYAQGDLGSAQTLLERALEIDLRVHGAEAHPDVASCLHALAMVLHAQGDLEGAQEKLEQSLRIEIEVQGTEEHVAVAASLHELARVSSAQGDLGRAKTLLERALVIQEKARGTREHLDIATCYASLGHCQWKLGLLEEGERALLTCLEILRKVLGTREHRQYAEAELALAALLQSEGRDEEARDLSLHARGILQF